MKEVFPTQVGMNRSTDYKTTKKIGIPHTGGDEPAWVSVADRLFQCSPHRWG